MTAPVQRRRTPKRKFETGGSSAERIDESQWIKPEADLGPPPVSLAPITMSSLTDADVGLPDDPLAQERAERFIAAAIAYRFKQQSLAREAARLASAEKLFPGTTVAVEVPDDAVTLIAPTDVLDEVDQGILRELRRLTARSPSRWRVAAA
ncbi:hypothetical protein EBB05_18490 [Methylobacterium brachiatum]|nr:hypothetical protein EBB05_18490 [Methylobacterium brachiatum]